jgi:hypothetical protein
MKISRKKLIKIAFKAIAQNDAEKQYSPPAREDRNHLLYAACTMPQVALGAWAINDQCGCLVGTMLLNEKAPLEGKYVLESDPLYMQVDDAMQPNHPLWDVGIAFDDLLRAYLADKYSADDPEELHQQPVDVVDA